MIDVIIVHIRSLDVDEYKKCIFLSVKSVLVLPKQKRCSFTDFKTLKSLLKLNDKSSRVLLYSKCVVFLFILFFNIFS